MFECVSDNNKDLENRFDGTSDLSSLLLSSRFSFPSLFFFFFLLFFFSRLMMEKRETGRLPRNGMPSLATHSSWSHWIRECLAHNPCPSFSWVFFGRRRKTMQSVPLESSSQTKLCLNDRQESCSQFFSLPRRQVNWRVSLISLPHKRWKSA